MSSQGRRNEEPSLLKPKLEVPAFSSPLVEFPDPSIRILAMEGLGTKKIWPKGGTGSQGQGCNVRKDTTSLRQCTKLMLIMRSQEA